MNEQELKALREEYEGIRTKAGAIHALCDAEKRSYTTEENEFVDKSMLRAKEINDKLDAHRKSVEFRNSLETMQQRHFAGSTGANGALLSSGGAGNALSGMNADRFQLTYKEQRNGIARRPEYSEEAAAMYWASLFGRSIDEALPDASEEQRNTLAQMFSRSHHIRGREMRANDLAIGVATKGNEFMTPTLVLDDMFNFVEFLSINPRQHLNYSLSVPKDVTTISIPQLVTMPSASNYTETSSGVIVAPTENTMVFGSQTLTPKDFTVKIKVSMLMQHSLPNAIAYAKRMMGQAANKRDVQKFYIGTGSGEPYGIFIASANCIPTSRNVATVSALVSSAAVIGTSDLRKLTLTVRQQYRRGSHFYLHSDLLKQAMLLKDTEGRWLFDSVNGTIDGYKYIEDDEFMPNTLTANQPLIVFGNPQTYYMADKRSAYRLYTDDRAGDGYSFLVMYGANDGRTPEPYAWARLVAPAS